MKVKELISILKRSKSIHETCWIEKSVLYAKNGEIDYRFKHEIFSTLEGKIFIDEFLKVLSKLKKGEEITLSSKDEKIFIHYKNLEIKTWFEYDDRYKPNKIPKEKLVTKFILNKDDIEKYKLAQKYINKSHTQKQAHFVRLEHGQILALNGIAFYFENTSFNTNDERILLNSELIDCESLCEVYETYILFKTKNKECIYIKRDYVECTDFDHIKTGYIDICNVDFKINRKDFIEYLEICKGVSSGVPYFNIEINGNELKMNNTSKTIDTDCKGVFKIETNNSEKYNFVMTIDSTIGALKNLKDEIVVVSVNSEDERNVMIFNNKICVLGGA